jgi:hypothetical protein
MASLFQGAVNQSLYVHCTVTDLMDSALHSSPADAPSHPTVGWQNPLYISPTTRPFSTRRRFSTLKSNKTCGSRSFQLKDATHIVSARLTGPGDEGRADTFVCQLNGEKLLSWSPSSAKRLQQHMHLNLLNIPVGPSSPKDENAMTEIWRENGQVPRLPETETNRPLHRAVVDRIHGHACNVGRIVCLCRSRDERESGEGQRKYALREKVAANLPKGEITRHGRYTTTSQPLRLVHRS